MMLIEETSVMRDHRPKIGITMRYELESERFYLARDYSEAVEWAGGVPLHIPLIPKPDYIESIVDGLDGVLLPGSASDVDPLLYGYEPHGKLGAVHPLRDETDMLLLSEVERRKLPLLAICYGIQVLNVFRGGTLIQDIGSQVSSAVKHDQSGPRDRPSHKLRLAADSHLASLACGMQVVVNSHHHQAIETVGDNLKVTAWAFDEVIEGVEDTRQDYYVMGVQWHPEVGWRTNELGQRLFKDFVEKASGKR
jgi:putative glutamine amidotransferase